jgi:hypothetical protein
MNLPVPLDAARHRRISELVKRADELSPADWGALLAEECGADASLKEDALRLLHRLHASGEGDLLQPAPPSAGAAAETVTYAPTEHGSAEPARIGKYQQIRRFSQASGQAAAYLAFDPDLSRHVVLKRYHGQADEETGEIEEGRALARVRSPYVAGCLGVDRAGEEPFLVVEYIPGRNLAEVRADGPFEHPRAVSIVTQLAEGVAAVHACGLIHRDIKPANVILHDDGSPRLVDFGLAAHLGSRRLRWICGTPAYMPPEQARGEGDRIDQRSDVFALGAVLYFLLTGRAPYAGTTAGEIVEAARKAVIAPPRGFDPAIPKAVEAVCLKALAAAPENRYASAQEFRQALLQAAGPGVTARKSSRFATRRMMGAAALVLAACALIVWYWASYAGRVPVAPLKAELAVILYEEMGNGWRVQNLGELTAASIKKRPPTHRDGVRIRVKLSRPAYFYLIGLNADGTDQLCGRRASLRLEAPKKPLEFPDNLKGYYWLVDGLGLHAYLLVASDRPLPDYETWKSQVPGGFAWTALANEGFWTYDCGPAAGSHETGTQQGETPHHDDAPAPLAVLCDRISRQPGIVLVHAVAFPVKDRAK